MLFKILHGDASRISTEITPFHEGYCYVTHDGYMYIDMNIGTVESPNNQRIKLNSLNAETLCGMSLEELKEYVSAQDIVVLGEAQSYTDAKIAEIPEQVQADWAQTDDAQPDFIKNKPDVITPEVMLSILDDAKLAQPVADGDNSVLTTDDNQILIL